MNKTKYLSGALFSLGVIFLAGCGHTPATTVSTNQTVGANNNAAQHNEAVATNDAVVDTSDWLTYTNEEYGFSFKYPNNYSFDESHEGVNFQNAESDSTVANQENIKFYIQSYSEAPDKEGEAYALLYTKTELALLKDEMTQDADRIVNDIPLNIYYSYDVPGEVFYKGANFFSNQDYISVSMVIVPTGIEYPNHPFNGETRKWSNDIVQKLNAANLISQNDQMRIEIFDTMINTLQLL